MITFGEPTVQPLHLTEIRLDGDTQQRVELNQEAIDEYAEAMLAGAEFPPVEVVYDGVSYWLWDGFTRFHASSKANRAQINARVVQGTKEAAQWLSYGANAEPRAQRRTKADKQKAVLKALAHPHAENMSDIEIARHCGVSDRMVSKYRRATKSEEESVSALSSERSPDSALTNSRPAPSRPSQPPQRADVTDEDGFIDDTPAPPSHPPIPPRKAMKDRNGVEIPERLRAAFATSDREFASAHRALAVVQEQVVELSRILTPEAIAQDELDRACKEVFELLERARPVYVCDSCKGRAGGCRACRGRGYMGAM